MRCEDCRDAISARLDGEDVPGAGGADGADGADVVERHLDACGDCRVFADRAAHVTRLARIRPAEPVPDVLPGLLTALDAGAARSGLRDRARDRARDAVRLALAVLGAGQLALALSGVVAAAGATGTASRLAGASMTHFSHESAAWNLALGVAFLWAASGAAARRANGLIPVIGAFVALLLTLSTLDLLAGHVEVARLLGHAPVVAGLALLLVHRRLGRDGGGATTTPEADAARPADRSGFDGGRRDDGDDENGLQPTAQHRAA